MPGARSSGRFRRAAAGICANNSSAEARPQTSSISRRSESDFGRYRKLGFSSHVSLIVRSGEKTVYIDRVIYLDLDEPGCAVRVFVQLFGCGDQRFIGFNHLAAHGCIDIGHGFDGFHRAEALAGFELRAGLWQIDVDDVAEFMLRMIGDPEGGGVALEKYPFMLSGVAEVLGKSHFCLL